MICLISSSKNFVSLIAQDFARFVRTNQKVRDGSTAAAPARYGIEHEIAYFIGLVYEMIEWFQLHLCLSVSVIHEAIKHA